jgi:hypothetical protein
VQISHSGTPSISMSRICMPSYPDMVSGTLPLSEPWKVRLHIWKIMETSGVLVSRRRTSCSASRNIQGEFLSFLFETGKRLLIMDNCSSMKPDWAYCQVWWVWACRLGLWCAQHRLPRVHRPFEGDDVDSVGAGDNKGSRYTQ